MALTAAEEKQYAKIYQETRNDIRAAARLLNFQPYGGQRDFLDMVEALTLNPEMGPKQLGVKSGTGCGKTRTLAFVMWWRTWRSPGTLSVNSAPTERQCRTVFFRELSELISSSPLVSRMMEVTEARAHFIGKPHWQIVAATASDENALRGFHHPQMTIGCEEITGIHANILNALLRTCSQKENLWIGIFNPDKIVGLPYEMFYTKRKSWPWNLTIDKLKIAKEAPHIVDPKILDYWLEEHGEDSDFWRVGVLGEFPLTSTNGIIGQKLINKAASTPIWQGVAGNPDAAHIRVISVDFARAGGDENVIYARSGNAIVHSEILVCEPRDAAFAAMKVQESLGWDDEDVIYVVDSVGMGQGLLIHFEENGKQISEFSPVNKSPIQGYKNRLSAAWYNLRTKMIHEHVSIPNDEILHEQLRTREVNYIGGEIEVESKKAYRKRGFSKSPDRADSLVMAFSEEEEIRESSELLRASAKAHAVEQNRFNFTNSLIY